MTRPLSTLIALLLFSLSVAAQQAYIRINLLGYRPGNHKVAVWCSAKTKDISTFRIISVATGKIVHTGKAGIPFGSYGPFQQTYRLNFSDFRSPGKYKIQAGDAESPEFTIGENVYAGTADFCLHYMRQQ